MNLTAQAAEISLSQAQYSAFTNRTPTDDQGRRFIRRCNVRTARSLHRLGLITDNGQVTDLGLAIKHL